MKPALHQLLYNVRNWRPVFAVCLLICLFAGPVAASSWAMGGKPQRYSVGMQTFGVWEPEQKERFDFAVFYPSVSSEKELVRDGWKLRAAEGGRVAPGFYPVLLLSHDTASSRFANADMALTLAESGFIVIAPTHAGDSQNNSEALYSAGLMASRPRELLLALDSVLGDAKFAPYADESRIGLLGVGFGSITSMQLAGARPDFSSVQNYCGFAERASGREPFCTPWVRSRMAELESAMLAMEKTGGAAVFTPPLSLFAPVLEAVLPQRIENGEGGPAQGSLWQHYFSRSGVLFSGLMRQDGASFLFVVDFDGGPLFGDEVTPFIYLNMSEPPQLHMAVANDAASELPSPVTQTASPEKEPVYRRPAFVRQIQGIALVAPAGGMLFSPESLAELRAPVLIIEAGEDELYEPDDHSRPYLSLLPARPQVLHLSGADHFSLFAECSQEAREELYDTCGKLPESTREAVHALRDESLVGFFRSVLGAPEPVPSPSGLVARPFSAPPEPENRGKEM